MFVDTCEKLIFPFLNFIFHIPNFIFVKLKHSCAIFLWFRLFRVNSLFINIDEVNYRALETKVYLINYTNINFV